MPCPLGPGPVYLIYLSIYQLSHIGFELCISGLCASNRFRGRQRERAGYWRQVCVRRCSSAVIVRCALVLPALPLPLKPQPSPQALHPLRCAPRARRVRRLQSSIATRRSEDMHTLRAQSSDGASSKRWRATRPSEGWPEQAVWARSACDQPRAISQERCGESIRGVNHLPLCCQYIHCLLHAGHDQNP